tara:strand:- start:1108 stop:2118 length:1011 start_codon:yes stop_codon:yes gene_type:complete
MNAIRRNTLLTTSGRLGNQAPFSDEATFKQKENQNRVSNTQRTQTQTNPACRSNQLSDNMAQLKKSDYRKIDQIFDMTKGYVLDFSNRTFGEFFEDELRIDIDAPMYEANGDSKAKRLRTLLEIEPGEVVAKVLRSLWQHKLATGPIEESVQTTQLSQLEEICERVSGEHVVRAASSLKTTAKILDLDTVNRDLARAMDNISKDPEDAITAACSTIESVCRSILLELGLSLPNKKDLKSLFNATIPPLQLNPNRTNVQSDIATDVRKTLSGLASVVDGIGALRTHAGDAHGREKGFTRIDARIAELAVNSANTVALFLIKTWRKRYPTRNLYEHSE